MAIEQTRYDQLMYKHKKLHINNFGFYSGVEEDIRIMRNHGRKDYHLLYVSSGEIEIDKKILNAGNFYVFIPGEKQHYTYKKSKDSLYYWVHFIGKDIADIIEKSNLPASICADCGRKKQADTLFSLLVDALKYQCKSDDAYALSIFYSILHLLSLPIKISYPYKRAAATLEDVKSTVSISSLAEMYSISTAHFIRSFKATYGETPASFRTNCRLSKSVILLTTTDLSINKVSELCGFSDSFYFCKIFKKHKGLSPSEYRKQHALE